VEEIIMHTLEKYQDFYNWQDELFYELSTEAGFEARALPAPGQTANAGTAMDAELGPDLWDAGLEGLSNQQLTVLLYAERAQREELQSRFDEAMVVISHHSSFVQRILQVLPKAIRQGILDDTREQYRQPTDRTVNVDSDLYADEDRDAPAGEGSSLKIFDLEQIRASKTVGGYRG
jgi:hypothetical protein